MTSVLQHVMLLTYSGALCRNQWRKTAPERSAEVSGFTSVEIVH